MTAPKKRNPQDATLRNTRAANRQLADFEIRLNLYKELTRIQRKQLMAVETQLADLKRRFGSLLKFCEVIAKDITKLKARKK